MMGNKRKRYFDDDDVQHQRPQHQRPIELARQRWAATQPGPPQLGSHRVSRGGDSYRPLTRHNPLDFDQRNHDRDERSAHKAKRQKIKRVKLGDFERERDRAPDLIIPEFRAKPSTANTCPWLKDTPAKYSPDAAWRLHTEIEQFYDFVTPTEYEKRARAGVILEIRDIFGLRAKGPGYARVDAFGSFAMNLNLPSADIDLVLIEPQFSGEDAREPHKTEMSASLSRHQKHLHRSRAFQVTNVIKFSRIPLIKFQHITTGLDVDLSFNNLGGIPAISLVKQWTQDYVAMPPLVMIIKQLLLMRDMNDVAYEGMGSFTIICLVTSYLMQHPKMRNPQIRNENLQFGELLIGFLQLYGTDFDRAHVGILMEREKSSYFRKAASNPQDATKFHVINPLKPFKDIATGTRRAAEIAAVFEDARIKLEKALKNHEDAGRDQGPESLLGCIIGGDYSCYMDQRARLQSYDKAIRSRHNGH